MLMALLRNKRHFSTEDIARSILEHDQGQVEYYEKITKDMVCRVLRKVSQVVRGQ